MCVSYLFFDLDGTLADSSEGILGALSFSLRQMGLPVPGRQTLTRFIGPPLARSFSENFALSPADTQRAISFFHEYYSTAGRLQCRLYNGIPELLQSALDCGYRLAVATCKPQAMADAVLGRLEIDGFFDVICGPEDDSVRTEKHEVIAHVMQALRLSDPRGIRMIGDRQDDALGAARNGVSCLGALWGFGSEQELRDAGADRCFRTPQELSAHLQKQPPFHEN